MLSVAPRTGCFLAVLAIAVATHAEVALVVSKEGLSPELSAKVGKLVEGTISPDGASISIGGDDYPGASFGLNKDGCFEVGIQQGIESGIFEQPDFAGTGEYEGESIAFSADISADVAAEAEICPTVPEPFQLRPEPSTTGPDEHPQNMLVVGVVPARAKAGESLRTMLIAYCLDQGRSEPGTNVKFSISPTMKIGAEFAKKIAAMSGAEAQRCLWSAFPDEVWKTTAWRRLERYEPTDDIELAEIETKIRESLGQEESGLTEVCPVAPKGLAGSFTRTELDRLAECWRKFNDKEQCIYR